MKEYKSCIEKISLVREKTTIPRVQINSAVDINIYIRKLFQGDMSILEKMYIILVNNSNNTIGYQELSTGGITGTLVDVRIVAKYCLETLATACILVHNHPSGTLKPSSSDIALTKKADKALKLIDVKLLDHVIITPDGKYLSMANESLF